MWWMSVVHDTCIASLGLILDLLCKVIQDSNSTVVLLAMHHNTRISYMLHHRASFDHSDLLEVTSCNLYVVGKRGVEK